MKKLLYSIIALTGLAMASCTQEHIDVQYNPEAVVAPVLGTVANVDFTKDDAAIEIDYTFADFKVATNVANELYINLPGNDLDKKVKVDAEITKEKGIKVELLDLYEAILALGVEADKEVAVEYMVNAYLTTDKGAYVANTDTLSNVVTANVKYAAIVAPIMGSVASGELKEKNPDIVIDYTPAEFTLAAEHEEVYTLYVDLQENKFEKKGKVNATFADGKITVKNSDLNTAILNAGIEGGENADVQFGIVASVNNVAGASVTSALVPASFKTYLSNIIPSEKHSYFYVVGTINGWDHPTAAKSFDFIYNYKNDENLFAGIINMRKTDSASEFKFTAGEWGKDEHSMAEGTFEAEAASINLVAGGGANINVYQKHQYYGVEFDKTALTLTKVWAADQIGIIGLNGDWENDIVMEYNPKWARFYADIEATADTEIKFRADAAWTLDWGAGCEKGGDNIAVAAGKYRVYFNPVAGLLQFNAKAYDTEEDLTAGSSTTPEEPEDPEQPEGPVTEPDRWGVAGTFTGWGEQTDLYMSEAGEDLFVRKGVTVTAEDMFKIRFNNGWDVNYGAAGEVEPFAVTVGEKLTLVASGKNLSAPAGTYDIYFNSSTFDIWVMAEGETPGGVEVKTVKIYGDVSATGWTNCNAWIWDADDTKYTGDAWPGLALETAEVDGKTYYVFNCTPEMIGKTVSVIFNNGSEQTVDITGVALNDDVVITLTEKDGSGKWLASVNGAEPEKPAFPVLSEHTWGVAGSFNGWTTDVEMTIADGVATATIEFPEADTDKKFKVRADGDWANNFGYSATEEAPFAPVDGTEFAATFNGGDIFVEQAGKYEVALRIENEQGYLKITKL